MVCTIVLQKSSEVGPEIRNRFYRVTLNPCQNCSYRSKWLIGQVFGELINTLVKRAHVKNFTLGLGGNGDRLTHILIAAATAAVTPRKGRAKG